MHSNNNKPYKTIAISFENYNRLEKLGCKRDTFDDIVARLLKQDKSNQVDET
jgi:predicted CopG family antitoxin